MINVLIHPNLDKIVAAARRCLVLMGDRTKISTDSVTQFSQSEGIWSQSEAAPVAGGSEWGLGAGDHLEG